MICTKEKRLSYDERARAILAEMTFEEKVFVMASRNSLFRNSSAKGYNLTPELAGGVEHLGVPMLKFCDGPRGVVSGHSTCFPVSMARGATFDPGLERRVGAVIGKEVRANGGNFFGGVCMNLPYHPGGGRSQECYGEDSHHMGEMAAALVEGVQGENVIACIKHFAFNSMERARFKVNVTADKRTEREVYLPHFKKCVERGAAAVMSAYNSYQGKHCGHNDYLLRSVLKGEWGFDGFVMSDFMLGVRSAEGGIPGGCDVEMNARLRYTLRNIRRALKKGTITLGQIDEAALRIVRTLLAFEDANAGRQEDAFLLACPEHTALAREVAEKSITLLKNDGLLPLDRVRQVVLAGDLADIENTGDHGSSNVRPPYVKTLLRAMKEEYPGVNCLHVPTKEVGKASGRIREAEAVVIVCGMKHNDEGEFIFTTGGDRESLALHTKDLDMIDQVSRLNLNCVVVLMGGNVLLTHSWKDKVKAILFAYYPGMEGGGALADILFGKVNPSGKLPFAIAREQDAYPQVDWNARQAHYGYWHGYQKLDHEGRAYDYPYGFGLSYTTFALEGMRFTGSDGRTARFEAVVTNTGSRAGAEVVQLYIGWDGSAVERPVRVLKDFQKVHLEAGERRTVALSVAKEDLAYYDEKAAAFVAEDTGYTAFLGTDEQSCARDRIEFRF